MKSLLHNGVLVPPKNIAKGLTIKIKEIGIKLNDEQEEMAVAWTKKVGTPYVEDKVFQRNFHEDFSKKMALDFSFEDVDYSNVLKSILNERELKANLSIEEKKRQASERKAIRDVNKERFGFATVDGLRMEIGNYIVEPNSIFMGRGKHPWRGKWKEGPREEDIEINHIPKGKAPKGAWKVIEDLDGMWIARWRDNLTGKMKYVWPGDSSFLKQQKDIEKFEKAKDLKEKLDIVKAHIESNLTAEDLRRRKIATVCHLIDYLKFRVGDEKDDDEEADTVGASTLRPEHLCFNENGSVTFNFLGKDSIPMNITAQLPENVVRNLREFSQGARKESLFEGVNSNLVGDFLKEVMEGLSAKVFRTLYATETVEKKLRELKIDSQAPEHEKRQVALKANLEAAIVCNHKRTIPKSWDQSLQKKKDRVQKLRHRITTEEKQKRQKLLEEEKKYRNKLELLEKKLTEAEQTERVIKEPLEKEGIQSKNAKAMKRRLDSAKKVTKSTRERIRKLKNSYISKSLKTKRNIEERKRRNKAALDRLQLQLEAQELTRDYNLGTSLKNYIDPRIYYDWGKKVEYDWREYYPATLQKKFSWIEAQPEEE